MEAQQSVLRVSESETQVGHLYFWVGEDWNAEVPADQSELMNAFEDTAAVLRARFQIRDPQRFSQLFDRLLKLAQAGFNGSAFQLLMTTRSLEQFKGELVRGEGSQIKHEHLKSLGVSVLVSIVLIMAVATATHIFINYAESSKWIITTHSNMTERQGATEEKRLETSENLVFLNSVQWDKRFSVLHFGILLSGTMLGIWLSFSVRNMNLRFEQLQNPEADLMKPWIRLATFGLLALILALFFHSRTLVISMGDIFSTSRISSDALVAFAVGLCLGFSDKVLPTEVQKRVEDFFSKSGRPI
jgi:hypothetical protein